MAGFFAFIEESKDETVAVSVNGTLMPLHVWHVLYKDAHFFSVSPFVKMLSPIKTFVSPANTFAAVRFLLPPFNFSRALPPAFLA